MDEFYTPISQVRAELERRWNDPVLKEKVDNYFGREIPTVLRDSPKAILFRNIITPDGEFARFFNISNELNLTPVGLEYTQDKFVAFNEDKYSVASLAFYFGIRNNGEPRVYNKKIVDIPLAEGKPMSEMVTLWGEPLDLFHHRFTEASYPGFLKNIEDISRWLHYNEGGSKTYYIDLMALLIRGGVLFEDFITTGYESKFTLEKFIPAFKKAEEIFGVKPLIIELGGSDYENGPSWWYYKEEQKKIVDDLINSYKKIC